MQKYTSRTRQVFALLLALLVVFTSIQFTLPLKAQAAKIDTRPLGTAYFEFRAQSGGWRDLGTPIHYDAETGQIAYCADHTKDSPTGQEYHEVSGDSLMSRQLQNGIKIILEFGYPNDTNGFSENDVV